MPPTERQIALAARLGIELGDSPESLADKIIYKAVQQQLTGETPPPATEKQVAFAQSLGIDVSHDSKAEAAHRISLVMSGRHDSAVAAKAFKTGDQVVYEFLTPNGDGTRRKDFTIETISSISADGMVYFKNPRRGFACAWAVYLRGPTAEEIRSIQSATLGSGNSNEL
jgi:hypothetical protein